MNLQTHIRNNLWLAIQSTYQAANYSHAIVDAMHYLSDVLREKTGVDGDGASLVGQALGSDSPRLRLNKFQTETERNEQRGIEQILRGMYQAIRNPRSHEQIEDSQQTADAIIYFVDYLLGIIEKSEEPFVMSEFVRRVYDPDFVRSQRYATLLVDEIPANKRFDTLVAIYREKLNGDIYNIGLVVGTLLGKLTDNQVKQYLEIVSDELSTISDEKEFIYNLHLLQPSRWEQISEASALRVENRVIRAIREGDAEWDECKAGVLATWARAHFTYFKMKDTVGKALLEKLETRSEWNGDYSERNAHYVVGWFLPQLPHVLLSPHLIARCVNAISYHIREGNTRIRTLLIDGIRDLPDNWQEQFVEALKDLTDANNPAICLIDGTPFLTSDPPSEGYDDMPS